MESRDLIGLDRYPMPDSESAALGVAIAEAGLALTKLESLVRERDGKPMPTDRSEFYSIGLQIRDTERKCANAIKQCGFHLLWKVDIGEGYSVKPEYPDMIPKRPGR